MAKKQSTSAVPSKSETHEWEPPMTLDDTNKVKAVATPTIDPQLIAVMKEEELLAMYVQTQRGLNKDSESIKQGWVAFKKTITKENIDELLMFQRLNLTVVATRTQLGYNAADIAQIWANTKAKLNIAAAPSII